QRMRVERCVGAGAEVRHRADVADDLARRDLAQQTRVLDGAHTVADAVGSEGLDRGADGTGSGDLPRVGHRAGAALACETEGRLERRRRILGLAPAETDGHDAALAVLDREAGRLHRGLEPEAARDVGGEAYLYAVPLGCLRRAVAETGEHLVPRGAAADAL